MAELGRKATEAAASVAALANPFTRRVAEAIANVKADHKGGPSSRRKESEGDDDNDRRCTEPGTPFGFLDNMCGPMLRSMGQAESNDADDLAASIRGARGRAGASDRGRGRDRGDSG
eukprot:CAMPEP_0181119792 /NCGR_PEP_ID=MMETSP1071-20121207/23789_1 /TAXON_ID=35127 /ORGANISM="Thalassiosira sp., Strain NH16" /LENGTH=116 /DNA_ID=CAMNT_0023204359 /DNA_START=127 /DNA_END=474 /DNA_ORIENTATION=-